MLNNELFTNAKLRTMTLCWISLFLIFTISFYPGIFSIDTFYQYQQVLTKEFTNHHPTIMAIIWSLFNPIFGAGGIFVFHNFCYLFGILLLSYWFIKKYDRFPLSVVVLGFAPTSSFILAFVWKDTALTLSILMLTTLYIILLETKSKSKILLACLFFFSYYFVNVRHGMVFVAFPLFGLFSLYFFPNLEKFTFWKKVLLASLLGFIFSFSLFFIQKGVDITLKTKNNIPYAQLFYFDMAGILIRSGKIEKFPDKYLANSTSKQELISRYQKYPVDAELFASYGRQTTTIWADNNVSEEVILDWLKIILENPFSYIKHRSNVALHTLIRFENLPYIPSHILPITSDTSANQKISKLQEKIPSSKNLTQRILNSYSFLLYPYVVANLLTFLFAIFIVSYFLYKKEYNLPFALASSSILFYFFMFIASQKPDITRFFYWCFTASGINIWLLFMRWRYKLFI